MAVVIQNVQPILVGSGGSPVYLNNVGMTPTNTWSSGLCDCGDDTNICLKGCFCFCCLLSQNSATMDGVKPFCGPCYYPSDHFKNRTQAKSVFGIEHNGCEDACIPLCCGPCSECQIAREIRKFKTTVENPNQLVYVGTGGSPVYMPKENQPRNNQWSSELFACCDEFCLCMLACYRLPLVVAWNSYLLDANQSMCRCVGPSSAWKNRLQAQGLFSIPNEGCFTECLITHCCAPCSEVQIHRHTAAVMNAKAQAGMFIIQSHHLMAMSAPASQTMIATYQPGPQQQTMGAPGQAQPVMGQTSPPYSPPETNGSSPPYTAPPSGYDQRL